MRNIFNLKVDTSFSEKNKNNKSVKCIKLLGRSNSDTKKHRISIIKIKNKKK
tara:strand:- start:480 stop:635 length:156 start_codon:yes stop_codon:yes gene_type:complete